MLSDGVTVAIIYVVGGLITTYITFKFGKSLRRPKQESVQYIDDVVGHYVKIKKELEAEVKQLKEENELLRNMLRSK